MVDGSSFVFEELQMILKLNLWVKWPRWFSANYKQLQTISKLELGGKWVIVVFEKLQTIKKQLQIILKLEVEVKWLHAGFRRTKNEKN